MLVWPLLIAGVFALPEVRPKVISLFDAFQGDYFEDLVVAVSLFVDETDETLTASASMPGRTVEIDRSGSRKAVVVQSDAVARQVCAARLGKEGCTIIRAVQSYSMYECV